MSIVAFSQHLTVAGDGTGANSFVGDYLGPGAITPFVECPAAETMLTLQRMLVAVRYTGAARAERYGAVAALANGIVVRHIRGGDTLDLTAGVPVTDFVQWGGNCYDVGIQEFGAGDNYVLVRWTFAKDFGGPLVLLPGDRFEVLLQDLFLGLGLVTQRFKVSGHVGRSAELAFKGFGRV